MSASDIRYATAIASISLLSESSVLDMTPEDFEFMIANRVWIATDRNRARRCIEAACYGTVDYIGLPRFPVPAEYVSAVIAHFVHPVNIQTACAIMDGVEFTENVINGVERCVSAQELFAHVLRLRAGDKALLARADDVFRGEVKLMGIGA